MGGVGNNNPRLPPQSLSPQAIILRVAMGGAWTKETFNRLESGMELSVIDNNNTSNNNVNDSERDIKSHSSSSHA
jgi:hypothetical protein